MSQLQPCGTRLVEVTNRGIPFQVRMSLCRLRQRRLPVSSVSGVFKYVPCVSGTYFYGHQSRETLICPCGILLVKSAGPIRIKPLTVTFCKMLACDGITLWWVQGHRFLGGEPLLLRLLCIIGHVRTFEVTVR